MCIIEEPLQELHIELKLSICKLFNLNSFINFKLSQCVIKDSQVPSIVILVFCIKV